ncbi:hypothetical protein HBN92_17590 [Pseudomonas fragi]|uniref:hypothetical protein n=1 Tax=Pseudomonas fragi TaxID=296 RepID=UPI001475B198|nr:hypothetical protein [Pseudomonas fragi]NNB26442.1 hypothetical protein [Pseudomonas fragi]
MPSSQTNSTKQLCLFLLIVTLYLIVSVAWFCLAIPPLTDHGSDAHLVGAFAGTALWIVAGYSIAIYVIRKAPRAQG